MLSRKINKFDLHLSTNYSMQYKSTVLVQRIITRTRFRLLVPTNISSESLNIQAFQLKYRQLFSQTRQKDIALFSPKSY